MVAPREGEQERWCAQSTCWPLSLQLPGYSPLRPASLCAPTLREQTSRWAAHLGQGALEPWPRVADGRCDDLGGFLGGQTHDLRALQFFLSF